MRCDPMRDGGPLSASQPAQSARKVTGPCLRTAVDQIEASGISCRCPRPSPPMIEVGCDMFLQQDHRPLLPILRACMREDRYPRLADITELPSVSTPGKARIGPPLRRPTTHPTVG